MALAFEQTPADILLPLFYAEVTSAQEPVPASLKMVLIGHMNKTNFAPGTALLNTLYLLTRTDANTLFGVGSQLAGMYEAARGNSRWTEIWGIAIPEDVDAIQATGTITVSSAPSATKNGVLGIYIGGRYVNLKVKSTDTANTVAANLTKRINQAGLTMKATVSTNVITLTCRWAGSTGNELSVTYVGPHGRRSANGPEPRLAKQLLTFVQPGGGAGEYAPPATYAALDSRGFDVYVIPYTSGPTLDASQNFMDGIAGQWSPGRQYYGHVFTAMKGPLSTLQNWGDGRNDPHLTILGMWKSVMPTWEFASALGAVASAHWANPPELSRPLQTLELRGMFVGSDDDESFSPEERELLLQSGISTFHVDDDTTVHLDRVRTLRKTNAYGDPDASWADAITMFQAMHFVRAMRAAITGAFPRAALTTQPSGIPGFASPAMIKLVIMNTYRRLQTLGLVENYDLFVQYLEVQRDEVDRNRVNCLIRPDFVNQLRVVATIVETHLELTANDPLLTVAA